MCYTCRPIFPSHIIWLLVGIPNVIPYHIRPHIWHIQVSDWWLQPLWKILVKWDDYSRNNMENKNMFQTTNQLSHTHIQMYHVCGSPYTSFGSAPGDAPPRRRKRPPSAGLGLGLSCASDVRWHVEVMASQGPDGNIAIRNSHRNSEFSHQ